MNRRFKDKYSLKITIGRTGEPFQQGKKSICAIISGEIDLKFLK